MHGIYRLTDEELKAQLYEAARRCCFATARACANEMVRRSAERYDHEQMMENAHA